MTTNKAMILSVAFGMLLLAGTVAAQQQDSQVNNTQQATPATTSQKDEPAVKASTEAKTTSNAPAEAVAIQSHTDKISYALGVEMARDLQQKKDDMNVDLFMRALTDALAGKNLMMTDEEAASAVKTFDADQRHDIQHAKMMIALKNKKAVEEFVAENVKKEGVVTLPSGLQYKILKQGDGKTPTADDMVVCNYTGTLIDGSEFDSTSKRGKPATLPVKGVMPGWTQALQLMPVGSKWQIFIPPHLAFGEKEVPGIGTNAMLIFEVELLSIQDKPQSASAEK